MESRDRAEKIDELAEALAAYAHAAWSGWMKRLFSKGTTHTHRRADGEPTTGLLLPEESVERWQRQMETPYAELPEQEKGSDRKEAQRILEIIRQHTGKENSAEKTQCTATPPAAVLRELAFLGARLDKLEAAIPFRVEHNEREDPHRRCKRIADVPSLRELKEQQVPTALVLTAEGGPLTLESVWKVEDLLRQRESLRQDLRHVKTIVGVLMQRLGESEVHLRGTELAASASELELWIEHAPETDNTTVCTRPRPGAKL